MRGPIPWRWEGMYLGSSPQMAPSPASSVFEIVTSASRAANRLAAPDPVRPHSSGVFHAVCQDVVIAPTPSERGPMLPSTIQPIRSPKLIGTYGAGVDASGACPPEVTSVSCAASGTAKTLNRSVRNAALMVTAFARPFESARVRGTRRMREHRACRIGVPPNRCRGVTPDPRATPIMRGTERTDAEATSVCHVDRARRCRRRNNSTVGAKPGARHGCEGSGGHRLRRRLQPDLYGGGASTPC